MTTGNSSEDMAYAYTNFITDIDMNMNMNDINAFDLNDFDNLAGLNIYADPPTTTASQISTQPQYHQADMGLAPSLVTATSQQETITGHEFSLHSHMQDVSSDFTQILHIAHPQTQTQSQPPKQFRFREQKPRKSKDPAAQQIPSPQSSSELNPVRPNGVYVSPLVIGPRGSENVHTQIEHNATVNLMAAQRDMLSPQSSPVLQNVQSVPNPGPPPLHHLLSGRKPNSSGKQTKKGGRATPSPRLGVSGGGVSIPSKRGGLGKRTMSAPSLRQKSPPSTEHSPDLAQNSATSLAVVTSSAKNSSLSFSAPATPGSLMKITASQKPHPHPLLPSSVSIPGMIIPSLSPKPLYSHSQQLIVPVNGNALINPASPNAPRPTPSKSSPVALKPLISPQLKPLLPGVSSAEAAERLTTKSNYQNLLEGDTLSLGLSYSTDIHSGIELRRTSHKAAEQKRRDSLKRCFDELRKIVPNLTERNPSKVYLLQKSHTYINVLKTDNRAKDERIATLRSEVRDLKMKLGVPLTKEDEEDEPESIMMMEDNQDSGERISEGDDLDDDEFEGESPEE